MGFRLAHNLQVQWVDLLGRCVCAYFFMAYKMGELDI
ncbi:hypothetical protein HNQ64_001026 [Prosthecobacter dejongeii]|uniref:Uncharacterized protein n=1 Tax=Prosthecobacter dejongeii TaxID=48465 RepID=A0A7W7YIR2_9BACT|nr:hypothetical protein [Prosthecobacter dejongeii]